MLPRGWEDLSPAERDVFRDDLEDWTSKARAQPQIFADEGARAVRLLELTKPPGDAVGWSFLP